MTRLININENGIYMVFALIDDEKIRLIHLGTAPFNEKAMPENAWENGYLVQYQETGYGSADQSWFVTLSAGFACVRFAGLCDAAGSIWGGYRRSNRSYNSCKRSWSP